MIIEGELMEKSLARVKNRAEFFWKKRACLFRALSRFRNLKKSPAFSNKNPLSRACLKIQIQRNRFSLSNQRGFKLSASSGIRTKTKRDRENSNQTPLRRLSFCAALFSLAISAACIVSSESGEGGQWAVRAIVNPYGPKDEIRSAQPIIYKTGGDFHCRPSSPDQEDVRRILEKQEISLDKDSLILDIFNLSEESEDSSADAGAAALTTEGNEKSRPVTVTVGDGWLKFGLVVFNGNQNFHLVITEIAWYARSVGVEGWSASGNVVSNYCGSQVLYFVPPGKKVDYRPHSKSDILSNLTIYLSGFQLVDRTTQPSRELIAQTGGPGGGEGGGSEAGLGGDGAAGAADGTRGRVPENCTIFIPKYRVELVLRGYFITPAGTRVRDVADHVHFTTRSSFADIGC